MKRPKRDDYYSFEEYYFYVEKYVNELEKEIKEMETFLLEHSERFKIYANRK